MDIDFVGKVPFLRIGSIIVSELEPIVAHVHAKVSTFHVLVIILIFIATKSGEAIYVHANANCQKVTSLELLFSGIYTE